MNREIIFNGRTVVNLGPSGINILNESDQGGDPKYDRFFIPLSKIALLASDTKNSRLRIELTNGTDVELKDKGGHYFRIIADMIGDGELKRFYKSNVE